MTENAVTEKANPNRARDHLANERTFLAWVRTGAAIVVFGFAILRGFDLGFLTPAPPARA